MAFRIMIVEDDDHTREFLSGLISGSDGFEVVSHHRSLGSALGVLAREAPNVLLLDLELPDTSGSAGVQKAKTAYPPAEILVLTGHDQPDWLFPALEAGASGYLIKPPCPTEILEAIRKVVDGGSAMSAAIARRVLESFRKPARRRPEPSALTPTEEAVLRLVARGLRNKEVAEELHISVRTVETHMGHITRKLSAHSRTEAAMKWVQQKGQRPPDNQTPAG